MIKQYVILSALMLLGSCRQHPGNMIYRSAAFALYRDSVAEGQYVAKALSRTAMTSNYVSPGEMHKSPGVSFKFSINGGDNAAPSGKDCKIICAGGDGNYETPVIKFGEQYIDTTSPPAGEYLRKDTKLTIRVDMNVVLQEFKDKGYFTCFDGKKVYKSDFKGVFVAGGVAPLTWDFNNLHAHKELQMQDADEDGIYEITLILNQHPGDDKTPSSWKLENDISAFPQYHSPDMLPDALYNLALSEMQRAIEADSTFRTGKEWAGVWTRDISYSIILSMAILQPKVAMISLKRKVKNGRIIQDTGTGGAYPVSTDRMIWAVAAWEVYKVTGDRNWLAYAYKVISQSANDDEYNICDKNTGLVRGESSFLDWREQTYPVWMQPADIYESECLGTNAVHYEAAIVLAEMADALGFRNEATHCREKAMRIKSGINKYLWLKDKGYYGQYLYGRVNKILSPKSEALGEALVVLFGIADSARARSVIARTPVTPFGITCIFPQIPGIPPYHNNAVWPFVESYWALASAKAGNESSVIKSMSAVYRPAALFLTNKENFVAANGDYAGTQINSDNMLWSLSGSIALVYKVLFGIQYQSDHILFKPFVPKPLSGKRTLSGFRYRNAILDIEMEGDGNSVKSFLIDGKESKEHVIASSLKGQHVVKIVLAGNDISGDEVNDVDNSFTPQMPLVRYHDRMLTWSDTGKNIAAYKILYNGNLWKKTKDTAATIVDSAFGVWQVIAVSREGVESFASEPLWVYPGKVEQVIQLEKFNPESDKVSQGFTGHGFVETSTTRNLHVKFSVEVPHDGAYILDIRYANGNGPVNTENKCAVRTLLADGKQSGVFVFPQRGKGEWSNWGWSNAIKLTLSRGIHHFVLSYEPYNENMNGMVNQALLDNARLIAVGS